MPLAEDRDIVARAKGMRVNTHPRLNGDVINTPDDVLEGIGNFSHLAPSGDPLGWRLGEPEAPTGRNVYVGFAPDATWRQNASPLSNSRPSFLLSQPVAQSVTAPTPGTPLLAKVPKPKTPVLKKVPAASSGYPLATAQNPYRVAFSFSPDGIRHTMLSPYSDPFALDFGQSARVSVPEEIPAGLPYLGVWMSEPGTSRPESPGPMYLQRVVYLPQWFLAYYDLTGPYRRLRTAPTTNETVLPRPGGEPAVNRASGPWPMQLIQEKNHREACRNGSWRLVTAWTDENGETLSSSSYVSLFVPKDTYWSRYDDDGTEVVTAGAGHLTVYRPVGSPPKGATGWRAYLYNVEAGGGWARVVDRFWNYGGERPYPATQLSVSTGGWTGSEEPYGVNEYVILEPQEIPTENTTGYEDPTAGPDTVEAIGAERPSPGRLWVRITNVLDNGRESLPSDPAYADMAEGDLLEVFPVDDSNLFANASTFVETTPDALPTAWQVTKTGGDAYVSGQDLIMETLSVQSGTTPSAYPDPVAVDTSVASSVAGAVTFEPPKSGAAAGTCEVVFREISTTGAITDRVILTITSVGGFEYYQAVNAFGAGGFAWTYSGGYVTVLVRMAGASKNMKVKVHSSHFRPYKHHKRHPRGKKPGHPPVLSPPPPPPPGHPPPVPEFPAPPVDRTTVEAPPEPPWSPETTVQATPDRPLNSAGTIREQATFEAGLPSGWATNTSGGATAARDATAALLGSFGLRLRKATGGTAAAAYLSKTAAPPNFRSFRHGDGLAAKNRFATWPANGRVSMHALARPSDGARFAWLEASASAEAAELTILDPPSVFGSVSVTLGGVSTNVAVVATPEVASLSLAADPTTPGTVTVTLGGINYNVPVGGTRQVFTLTITGVAQTKGNVYLTVDGVTRQTAVSAFSTQTVGGKTFIAQATSPSLIAERIRLLGWPGWNVTRSSATLTFTADLPGPRGTPAFSPGTTGVPYALNISAQGGAETKEILAQRIRETRFPNWVTGGSGSTVTFTATRPGAQTDASYSSGNTGATGTMTTPQQGAVDSTTDLATRIRNTAFTGWTTGGSGSLVTFTATSAGVKTNSGYSAGGTGASGRFRVTVQGTNLDVVAKVKDRYGNERQRKIMSGLTTATVFNTDVAVSGAGTSRAVVSFWGSTGTNPLTHLGRLEDVDLEGYPTGTQHLGVFAESSNALTWDLHVDDVYATERGRNWYRDHDEDGGWLSQVVGDYSPDQPPSDDLFLQDGEAPVVPGGLYALSGFFRWEDIPTSQTAYPLVVKAVSSRGIVTELGDITTTGLTGSGAWQEFERDLTIPADVHRLKLGPRDIGGGQFVAQEIVLSPGTFAKRTGLYQATGTYTATLDTRVPNVPNFLKLAMGQRRKSFSAEYETPSGTSATAQFRSASADTGPWSAYQTDPSLVPDQPVLQMLFTGSGGGLYTAILKAGSPRAEYERIYGARKRIPTLLKEDRSELPGGAVFQRLREWSERPVAGVVPLPSGELYNLTDIHGAIGFLPSSELLLFTKTGMRYVEQWWKRPFYVETDDGELLRVRLSGQPDFEKRPGSEFRQGGVLDPTHAVYLAKLPAAWVVSAGPMP